MGVRVGFVGVGKRARVEMRDLLHIPDAEIVAFCDVSLQACRDSLDWLNGQREGQPPLDLPTFADAREMLEGVDLDAVYVSLPPGAHGDVEHAVVDAGKAIFVEKPLATTMKVAREIDGHIRRKGVVSSVGYQFRYVGAVQRARAILDGVPIGLVIAIRLGGLPATPWWRVQAMSGGMLIEQHTHGVDLVRYLAGDVVAVSAFANTALLKGTPNLDIADVNSVTCRFANGAVGTIVNSCAAPQGGPPNVSGPVQVVAQGMTVTSGPAGTTVLRPGEPPEEIPATTSGNLEMNRAFIKAVASGDSGGVQSTYADALKTFEITYASVLSAARGGEVVDLTKPYE